jgi:hypothetical protein
MLPRQTAADGGRRHEGVIMTIREIPGDEAHRLLRRNKTFRWGLHKPDTPPAPSRTRKLAFIPSVTPKFRLAADDTVFTIGSCFAREIEIALQQHGYVFATQDPKNAVAPDECTSPAGFFNKFTTASMLSEVRWAAASDEEFPDAGYIEAGNGRWIDGQMPATFATRERLIEVRGRMTRVFQAVKTAHVIVVTLGLVESWHDAQTGLYLNVTPDIGTVNKYPGRFSMRILDYAANLALLEEIYERVKAVNPDARFIVTVSPVPLGATFSGHDISVANAYSKATLRAVAGDFVAARDNADYFPSYEIATESAPDFAWLDDMIHVRRDLVRCIVAHFLENYGSEVIAARADLATEIERAHRCAVRLKEQQMALS